MKKRKPATNISFGSSTLSLFSVPGQLLAHGVQKTHDGTYEVEFDAAEAKNVLEVTKSLRSLLGNNPTPWLANPTIRLGFYQGLLALAEGLILDESAKPHQILRNLCVEILGTPKVYRGKIMIGGQEYNVVVYETNKIPDTDAELLVNW